MSQSIDTARTPILWPVLPELALVARTLRPLWRIVSAILLIAVLAVAHMGVRLRADQLRRELSTIETQAHISRSWAEALALDVETRRSTEHLEQVAQSLGLQRAHHIVRVQLDPAR